MNIDNIISIRINTLRKKRGYTLDKLAELSGVSRSMISLIEREETSPTATVLNKLSDALDISLASLLSVQTPAISQKPITRYSDQLTWQDPESGYIRRQLSSSEFASPLELAEITFQPGKSVVFANHTRQIMTHQQIWILEGEMKITVGNDIWVLRTGDCLSMTLGQQIVFRNQTTEPARYLIALATYPKDY